MTKRAFNHPLRYITRMDYEKNRGWWVRWEQYKKRPVQRCFSDGRYGGKAKALIAAKAFRDKNAPGLDVAFFVQTKLRANKRKKLPIGTTFVAYDKKRRVNGQTYYYPYRGIAGYYQVANAKQRRKTFGLATYTWDKALAKALRFRKQGLARRVMEKKR